MTNQYKRRQGLRKFEHSMHISTQLEEGKSDSGCQCPKGDCGFVESDFVSPTCMWHGDRALPPVRQMHWDYECPQMKGTWPS